MSSKKVPEKKSAPLPPLSIPEQMKYLKEWVMKHGKIVQRYRGKLEWKTDLLSPENGLSPSADQKKFKEFIGDIVVFRNAIAVFQRDGCPAAAECLKGVLVQRDVPARFPFEELLLEKRVPAVLLMVQPSKMLPLIKWMMGDTFWQLNSLWASPEDGYGHVEVSEETREIARILPSLEDCWRRNYRTGQYNMEIFEAIKQDILSPFEDLQKWLREQDEEGRLSKLFFDDRSKEEIFRKAWMKEGVAFAYLLRGMRQRDVLVHIPRKLQGDVATWQFEVCGNPQQKILLIPEDELPSWQGICQSSLSKGCSAGHAAVYGNHFLFEMVPNGQKREMKSAMVLRRYYC